MVTRLFRRPPPSPEVRLQQLMKGIEDDLAFIQEIWLMGSETAIARRTIRHRERVSEAQELARSLGERSIGHQIFRATQDFESRVLSDARHFVDLWTRR